jgi:hypothetical protein
MSGGDAILQELIPDFQGKLQKAKGVGDGRSILTNPFAQVVLTDMKLFDQMLEGLRFLDRVEVLPLQVFDERDFKSLSPFRLFHQYRNFSESGLLSGSPATFPYNQFITLVGPSDEEGFENPFLSNGLCQFLEF